MDAIGMLCQVICHTFEKQVGKGQGAKPVGERRALALHFRKHIDHAREEGYRFYDLLLYASGNYVYLYERDGWDVIPLADLGEDDEGPLPGKSYTRGQSEWRCLGSHDSGWRDLLKRTLKQNADAIEGWDSRDGWYEVVNPQALGVTP